MRRTPSWQRRRLLEQDGRGNTTRSPASPSRKAPGRTPPPHPLILPLLPGGAMRTRRIPSGRRCRRCRDGRGRLYPSGLVPGGSESPGRRSRHVVHRRSSSLHCDRDRRRPPGVAHGIAPEEGAVIAGHFGLAAAVKWRAPAAPLWLLMIATQWLDIVFVPLFVLGVERLVPLPGAKSGAYGQALIYADYTHSLFGALLLSAPRGRRFAPVREQERLCGGARLLFPLGPRLARPSGGPAHPPGEFG